MYEILADSDKGPMIALHRNTVCTQFPIDVLKLETLVLLQNFVSKTLTDISNSSTRLDMNLQDAIDEIQSKKTESIEPRLMN
jgi:hypothetical protein